MGPIADNASQGDNVWIGYLTETNVQPNGWFRNSLDIS